MENTIFIINYTIIFDDIYLVSQQINTNNARKCPI
jgi:hypothetical protein